MSNHDAVKEGASAGQPAGQRLMSEAGAENTHKRPLGFVVLFFYVGLAASLFFGWILFPKLLYCQKKQPFDFNHALHATLVANGCKSCHFFRKDGTFSGVPKLAQCIGCHKPLQGESKDEVVFAEQYVSKDREVPWLIYSRQPDCVFFSHGAHVAMAHMKCQTCHGDIGSSFSLPVYEQNRISGYSRRIYGYNIAGIKRNTWDRMKMNDCAQCHEAQTGSKGACFQCHK